MNKQNAQKKIKRVDIRISPEELKEIDEQAARCGFCRSDYIRLCLKGSNVTLINMDALDEVITGSRRVEQACVSCLSVLNEICRFCEDAPDEKTSDRIDVLKEQAEKIMELAFDVERQTIGILKKARRNIE